MSDSEEDWEEEEQEQEWGKAVKQSDSDWVDAGAASTPERLLPPDEEATPTGAAPKEEKHVVNSWTDFAIKNGLDVPGMINTFVQPKFCPETGDELQIKAKHPHKTLIDSCFGAKMGALSFEELEKLQNELKKGTLRKKKEKEDAEKQKKLDEVKREAEEKERLEKEKAEEAKEKGEEYVGDEDFFAGLE